MKNFFKNKNNLIIGLCAVVLIMGIGFAGFSQRLEISDTVSSTSEWDVYIKTVVPGTPVGGATGSVGSVTRTEASLITNLVSPGDSITYTVTVRNDGNIDAVIDVITLTPSNNNSVIKYSYAGITEDETITAQTEKNFTVTVEYDPEKTGTATEEQKRNSLTLDLDFVQKGNETLGGTSGVVYRWSEDELYIGDSIEGIETTTDPSTLGEPFYLKHEIDSNKLITASYICFVTDTEYCIQGGAESYYQNNLAILQSNESWFSECYDSGNYYLCNGGNAAFKAYAYKSGNVKALTGTGSCRVEDDDLYSYCSGDTGAPS